MLVGFGALGALQVEAGEFSVAPLAVAGLSDDLLEGFLLFGRHFAGCVALGHQRLGLGQPFFILR